MPEKKFSKIINFSSESQKHQAANLLESNEKSWKCSSHLTHEWIILEIEEQIIIDSIEISNNLSAFIEVLVSKNPIRDFQVLVPVFASMTPTNSLDKIEHKKNFVLKVKHFSSVARKESWKYIKFICSQPYNKSVKFGLSGIKIFGETKTNKTGLENCILNLGKFKFKKCQNNFDNKGLFKLYENNNKHISSNQVKRSKLTSATPTDEARSSKRKINETNHSDKKKCAKINNVVSSPNKIENALPKEAQTSVSTTEIPSCVSQHQRPSISKSKATKTSSNGQMNSELTNGKNKTKKQFGSIMSQVVFVLSGYENPLRSQLREKAIAMGAKYCSKWDSNCTHLICAFSNTPKFNEVKRLNGRIVSEKWIEESYAGRKLLEWRNFMVGSYNGPDTPPNSENEEDKCDDSMMHATTGADSDDSDLIYDLETEDEDSQS